MDTIEGGKWLPDQDLAWTLVTKAVERVHELENEVGCFFDRNPDGTLHGKAFAGQTFDRTVHKGDLTGIEIINRLMEQVWARPVRAAGGAPCCCADPGQGRPVAGGRADDRHSHRPFPLRGGQGRAARHRRRAHHVPLPHALRRQEHGRPRHGAAPRAAAARHGDGAVPPHGPARRPRHAHDRHGARGGPARRRRASAQRQARALHGGALAAGGTGHARFHLAVHVRGDARGPRHAQWRALHQDVRIWAPRRSPSSSRAWSSAAPTAASTSRAASWRWCRPRTTSWAGSMCRVDTSTELPGLFVAGEDASGMHGANRLGGNGVANSTVFGGIAGRDDGWLDCGQWSGRASPTRS